MNNKKKYNYLAKNTLLFTISSFGSKFLTFLFVPLYTAVLSTADYGIADLITTTSMLLVYIFTINISDSVMRFSIDSVKREGVFSYGIRVLFCGTFVFFVALISFSFSRILNLKWYFYLFLFLNFFLVAFNQIIMNYLRGVEKIKEVTIASIINTIVMVLSNIFLLLVIKMGLIGYLISNLSGVFVSIWYCLFCIRKNIFNIIVEKTSNSTKMEMRAYSIPLIFNAVAWWINSSLDKYFIITMCGASVNGIYAVASKIPGILTVFQQIFSQAWNLSAIKEFNSNDEDNFFSNTYRMYNAGLVLICSILIFFNISLARRLFLKDFFEAWRVSSILLLSVLFISLSGFFGGIFSATKNSKIFAISTIIAAIINTILNLMLIPLYSELGAAISTSISFYLVWLIRYYYSKKYIRWKISLIRDTISYFFLVCQIIVEHMAKDYLIWEAMILFFISILYYNEIRTLIMPLFRKFKSSNIIKSLNILKGGDDINGE